VNVQQIITLYRQPYYAALDAADLAWSNGDLDVSEMESLLSNLLTHQLKSAV
jgi:hypothetical protein